MSKYKIIFSLLSLLGLIFFAQSYFKKINSLTEEMVTTRNVANDENSTDQNGSLNYYEEEEEKPVVSEKRIAAEETKYIGMLPPQFRDAFNEYLQMVGARGYTGDIGGSNEGLQNFNVSLIQKNQCFNELAAEFYLEIKARDVKEEETIADSGKTLGVGELEVLTLATNNMVSKPNDDGWMWNEALRIANNDPNLAMSLIGVCGHDDIGLGLLTDSSGNATPLVLKNAKSIRRAERILTSSQQYIAQNIGSPDLGASAVEEGGLNAAELTCPDNISKMYQAGSLGSETRLPAELVNEIAKIQAPTKGANALPLKYYHTIGAAYLACTLSRSNMPDFITNKIQSVLINTYRMVRLCQNPSIMSEEEKKTMQFDVTTDPEKIFYVGLRKLGPEKMTDVIMQIDKKMKSGEVLSDVEQLLENHYQMFTYLLDVQDAELGLSEEKMGAFVKEKILAIYADMQAADLFMKAVVGSEDCYEIMYTGSRINKIREVSEMKTCPVKNMDASECEKAKAKLKTWWVDFKWSEKQHMLGASFAGEKCTPEKDFFNQKLEPKSCAALKKLHGSQAAASAKPAAANAPQTGEKK